MVDHSHDNTVRERTEIRETHGTGGSGTGLAFIVGGLVVAVAVLAWLFYGADVGGPSVGVDDGGQTSVSTHVDVGSGSGTASSDTTGTSAEAGATTSDGGAQAGASANSN